jgi:hypothetical protein
VLMPMVAIQILIQIVKNKEERKDSMLQVIGIDEPSLPVHIMLKGEGAFPSWHYH